MSRHQVGDLIHNGVQAGSVLALVARDPHWKTSGVRIMNVGFGGFDGNPGMTQFVPDYIADGWRAVPMDWAPIIGGGLEERYAWNATYTRLARELRRPARAEAKS
jgi:hypothetical protein